MPFNLVQVSVGQWCNHFLLPQESSASTMHLTTRHFKANTPVGASSFATYTTWALVVKIITVSAGINDNFADFVPFFCHV